MKRSLVKQGPTTLMVSLPSKWIKNQGLVKGDEVDIEEVNNSLNISPKIKEQNTLFLEIKNKNELYIWRNLQSAYVSGYCRLKIYHGNNKEIEKKIDKLVSENLLGMEVINQDKDNIIIESISQELDREFDNILRKVFYIVEGMFDSLLSFSNTLKRNNLIEIKKYNKSVRRYSLFLKRSLNRIAYSRAYANALNMVVNSLEEISKNIFFLSEIIKKKPSKEFEKYLKKIYEEFSDVERIFHKYNKAKEEEIITNKISPQDLLKLLKKDPNTFYLMNILSDVRKILFQRITIEMTS